MKIVFESLLGIDLTKLPISEIALISKPVLPIRQIDDRYYLEIPDAGIDFDAGLDKRVRSVHFHSQGHEDYRQFAGDLPEGISFSDSKVSVRHRLGTPSATGGGKVIQFFGWTPPWDRFDRTSYSLHVQYQEGEQFIKLVTLMRLDAVPK